MSSVVQQFGLFVILFLSVQITGANELVQLSAAADPWPPYIDDDMESGGVSVEIADSALRTQGYTVTNRIVPWARAIEETKQGRIDLILDAWWTQERSVDFNFSRPYIDGPLKFIKRKRDPFEFHSLNSLSGKRIALVRNYGYGDEFLQQKIYQRTEVTDFMMAIGMLEHDRVDLALENELVATTRLLKISSEKLAKFEFVSEPLSNNYVFIMSGYKNKRHQQIIAAFNRGLTVILENGVYDKILEKHHLAKPEFFARKKR